MNRSARATFMLIAGLLILVGLATLGARPAAAQTVAWFGEYFPNTTLSGRAMFTRDDLDLNFDWGFGSPGGSMPVDNFTVRWTRQIYFPGGVQRFAVTMDDGARVYVDGVRIIDSWFESAQHTVSRDMSLAAGTHTIVVEYLELTGLADVSLEISQVGGSGGGTGGGDGGDPGGSFPNWKGEYFTNANLAGAPALVRDDRYVNFDWGSSSPAPGIIPADFFSARWTRTGNYPAGQYRLVLTSDDGARLTINNLLLINDWSSPTLQPVAVDFWHTGGPASIKIEYFEWTGLASVRLDLIQVPPGGSGGGTSAIPQCPGLPYPTGLTAVNISGGNLYVRAQPSSGAALVGQYAPCAVIQLTGFRDASAQWAQVFYAGTNSWVAAGFILPGTPIVSLPIASP